MTERGRTKLQQKHGWRDLAALWDVLRPVGAGHAVPAFATSYQPSATSYQPSASSSPVSSSPTSAGGTPVIEMEGISKRFGTVRANADVSLTLRAGEVHAVLGENGAGKTTLMNILSGMYHPDAGTIRIAGQPVTISSPSDALRQGIGTVYQHFTLVPNLTIVENVILGMDTRFVLDLGDAERRLRTMLADFGMTASPRTEVRHLSLGERQRVEIIKVLFRGSRVLLLDEPTSVLTPIEVEGLFTILRRLKTEGVAVVLITHKLEEALEVSDRVTVLRQGRNVGELLPEDIAGAARATAKQRIVELMFGNEAAGGRRQAAEELSTVSYQPSGGRRARLYFYRLGG